MLGKYAFLSKLKLANPSPSFLPLSGSHLLVQEKRMLSFCSQDYLGLADSSELKKNAMRYLLEYGICSSTTYFKEGTLNSEGKLQEKLSHLLGKEASLFFHSRYQANVLALTALTKGTTVFMDRSCHSSLKEGVQRSGARVKYYKHNDMADLESLLDSSNDSAKWIVTESLFSQEGDLFSLQTLLSLAKKHDVLVYVDDSHALGVVGYEGMGLAAHQKEIDVIAGSFSKGCGAFGGYISCCQKMKDYLLHYCPEVSLCSLPPAILGAIDAALELLPHMEGERKQLMQRSHWIRKELQKSGFFVSTSPTPLVSLPCISQEEAQHLLKLLSDASILARAVYCPEEEVAFRVQIAITAHHSPEHLSQLAEALKSQAVVNP